MLDLEPHSETEGAIVFEAEPQRTTRTGCFASSWAVKESEVALQSQLFCRAAAQNHH